MGRPTGCKRAEDWETNVQTRGRQDTNREKSVRFNRADLSFSGFNLEKRRGVEMEREENVDGGRRGEGAERKKRGIVTSWRRDIVTMLLIFVNKCFQSPPPLFPDPHRAPSLRFMPPLLLRPFLPSLVSSSPRLPPPSICLVKPGK